MAEHLLSYGITVNLVSDSAVGHLMRGIDMVLIGAAGIAENGGIINKIGTYQIALVAHYYQKPLYVASESFKFARDLYPLSQADLPEPCKVQRELNPQQLKFRNQLDDKRRELFEINTTIYDYTPPEFITLMFTDLGILTPSAVSDELIKLEQRLLPTSEK